MVIDNRSMKCGFGGCALDPSGLRVCKDGPVFKTEILKYIDGSCAATRDRTDAKVQWKDM